MESWVLEAAPSQAGPREQRQQKAKDHCQRESVLACGGQGMAESLRTQRTTQPLPTCLPWRTFRLHRTTVHTTTEPWLVTGRRSPAWRTVAITVTIADLQRKREGGSHEIRDPRVT